MPKNPAPANGIQRECDMYASVKVHLTSRGWDVKAEVAGCDAMAMKDGRLLAAEMKLTLNLDVILQAVERQRIADLVYVAVPRKPAAMKTKRWRDTLELLKRLNIGLLAVTAKDAEELVEPVIPNGSPARGRAVRIRSRVVAEHKARTGDRNTGGVRGLKLVTAYREAALRLCALLAEKGPQSAAQMKPEGEKSTRTYLLLKNNHYGWFKPAGERRFDLTDTGRAALGTYAELLKDMQASADEAEVFAGTVDD